MLPKELDSLLAWIACIADAQPVESYAAYLRSAGLEVEKTEPRNDALTEMVHQIRRKLLGVEIMVGLKQMNLPGIDFRAATELAKKALEAITLEQIGYAIVCAIKPWP